MSVAQAIVSTLPKFEQNPSQLGTVEASPARIGCESSVFDFRFRGGHITCWQASERWWMRACLEDARSAIALRALALPIASLAVGCSSLSEALLRGKLQILRWECEGDPVPAFLLTPAFARANEMAKGLHLVPHLGHIRKAVDAGVERLVIARVEYQLQCDRAISSPPTQFIRLLRIDKQSPI